MFLSACHITFVHVQGNVWSASSDIPYHLQGNILPFGAKTFSFEGLWATYLYELVKIKGKNNIKCLSKCL